ncbi:MAG: acyl-CoA thioesterase [Prevotella sp.]|nr:acyl-CoA thioesterase [Prevotella sp.]
MKNYPFKTRMRVRDYECDIQGIVNNANYFHYAEHTRHLFLKSLGLSFSLMHEKGIDLVVARVNAQFKIPLKNDDEFISCLDYKKEGLKYIFYQDIYRVRDEKLCFRVESISVCIINGKLSFSEEIDKALNL